MPEWSSSHRRIDINRVSPLLHANAWAGVGSCPFSSLIVLFYALAQGSLLAYAGRGWMGMHAWSGGRVDRWEGGGPHQPGHCSSIQCGVAIDCSYYTTQVDHCQSLLQPWLLLVVVTHLKYVVWSTLVTDAAVSFFFSSTSAVMHLCSICNVYAYMCMWRPEWIRGGIRTCGLLVNGCHATTVQRSYPIFFLITGVITKKAMCFASGN